MDVALLLWQTLADATPPPPLHGKVLDLQTVTGVPSRPGPLPPLHVLPMPPEDAGLSKWSCLFRVGSAPIVLRGGPGWLGIRDGAWKQSSGPNAIFIA